VTSECLIRDVDAFDINHETVGDFIGDIAIPLLVLCLIARLDIAAGKVCITPVVCNSRLECPYLS
jgi:hypothetical protein